MIRIERHEEVKPGVWRYTVPALGLSGRSRQPLLDGCRQIRAIVGDTSERAGCSAREGPRPASAPGEQGRPGRLEELPGERATHVDVRAGP
jgi:hypothetical protein